jgi:gamma-glutamyltranspeptidase / glutathione hydrolase
LRSAARNSTGWRGALGGLVMHARLLRVSLALLAVLAVVAALATASRRSDPPTSIGHGGAAATVDRLASQAAIDVLKDGGNAVDAAVAAAAVLGVTEPFSCGVGGGGFMVAYLAHGSHSQVVTLDSREKATGAMNATSFWENGKPLPFNDARFSGMSVGVPGTLRAWVDALKSWGTISLAQALQPAVEVAKNGIVIDQTFFDQTQQNVDYFDDVPATAALYLDPDGTPHDVGTTFRNPDLAKTYELLAQKGPDAFYGGPLADAIVQTVTHPQIAPTANHVWRPGVMTTADLAAYRTKLRPPTHVTYRGLDVFGMGPPSSGGSTVGEALNILEGYDLAHMTREHALHLFLEASRYSFADRGAYLADPDFVYVPLRGLLSKQFAATRRALITDRAATSPVAPGDPTPFDGGGAKVRTGVSITETQPGTTTNITTADDKGDVVDYTFTIESTGGSGLLVPGYGFLLNNELTDFNYDSTTHPNRVEANKRPRSSISPTIILDKGKPFLAVGSPGGSTIITTVLQILLDRLDLGLTLPQAIADPRASQRNTPTTSAEAAFLQIPEIDALRARGHTFGAPAEIGAATGIEFLGGSKLLAAAEPIRRGGGSALVVKPK